MTPEQLNKIKETTYVWELPISWFDTNKLEAAYGVFRHGDVVALPDVKRGIWVVGELFVKAKKAHNITVATIRIMDTGNFFTIQIHPMYPVTGTSYDSIFVIPVAKAWVNCMLARPLYDDPVDVLSEDWNQKIWAL